MLRPCVGRCVGRGLGEAGVGRLPEVMSDTVFAGAPVLSIPEQDWLEVVKQQVSGLRFGSVEITIHEGRVVQVETSTKVRFDKPR